MTATTLDEDPPLYFNGVRLDNLTPLQRAVFVLWVFWSPDGPGEA